MYLKLTMTIFIFNLLFFIWKGLNMRNLLFTLLITLFVQSCAPLVGTVGMVSLGAASKEKGFGTSINDNLIETKISNLIYKYNEDLILDEVRDYINSTYGEHYAGGDKNIQIQDVFEQMDISEEFTRGCAMKYLFRFGKKNGKNRKDLLKCIHYVCLLYHYSFGSEGHNENN